MAEERDMIALAAIPDPLTFVDGLRLFAFAFVGGLACMGGYRAFTNLSGVS